MCINVRPADRLNLCVVLELRLFSCKVWVLITPPQSLTVRVWTLRMREFVTAHQVCKDGGERKRYYTF